VHVLQIALESQVGPLFIFCWNAVRHDNAAPSHKKWPALDGPFASIKAIRSRSGYVLESSGISHQGGRSFLQPVHVRIVGRWFTQGQRLTGLQARFGSRVQPFPYFSMTVSKGETACPIMVTGGVVHDLITLRSVRIVPGHINREPPIINSVFPFVEEHPAFCRGWIQNLGVLLELSITRCKGAPSLSQVPIHRNTTNPWHTFILIAQALIRWTLINPRRHTVTPQLSCH